MKQKIYRSWHLTIPRIFFTIKQYILYFVCLSDSSGKDMFDIFARDYRIFVYHMLYLKDKLEGKRLIDRHFKHITNVSWIRIYHYFKAIKAHDFDVEVLLASAAARALLSMQAPLQAFLLLQPYILDTDEYLSSLRSMRLRGSLLSTYIRACLRTGKEDALLAGCELHIKAFKGSWIGYYFLAINASTHKKHEYLSYITKANMANNNMSSAAYTLLIDANVRCENFDKAYEAFHLARKYCPTCRDLLLSPMAIENSRHACNKGFKFFREYFNSFGLEMPDNAVRDSFDGCLSSLKFSLPEFCLPENPVVSVIMTCYNGGRFIDTAIKSVLSQTYKNIELIVVDDHSTDNSAEKIKCWQTKDNRVTLIEKNKNEGTYVSKNRAILQANGDFITFLDSDDWMHPKRVELHLKHTIPKHVMSYSDVIRITESFIPTVKLTGGFTHRNLCSTFIRKEVFAKAGYFDSVRATADSEFFRRIQLIYKQGQFKHISLPLTMARVHDESLTTSGAAALDEYRLSPVRMKYCASWAKWHCGVSDIRDLYVPFPHIPRAFDAPDDILSPDITA